MLRLTKNTLFDSNYLSRGLARESVRGGMTTMTAQGIQFVLSLAGTMVLARLLTPSDFGLIGMVTVVVNFAAMFKDAGLSMATVQRERISHEQISTLFWLNIYISASIGLCVLAGSPLVSWFYGRPELTVVTAALSVSFLINGLTIQHQALLRRHLRFGTLAVIRIVSYVVNLVVAILLALIGWRYWALVGGTLATALSGTLLTFFFCPWKPSRMKKGTGVRGMLKFGGHLTGFNFVNYFSRNADNLLIGKFIGADALGLYAKAYQLFMLPISQIRGPLNQVAMPVLSSLQNQPKRYIKYYERLINIMASLTIPLALYCIIEADFLIKIFLGSQWLGAVTVFRILAIVALIQPVASTRGLVLVSLGFSSRYFYYGLITAIVCVASFAAGLPYGIEGVALSYTIANYAILMPLLFYCFHKTPVTVSSFFTALLPSLATTIFSGGTVLLVKRLWDYDSFLFHGICLAIFIFIYSGLSMLRKSVRETVSMILNRAAPIRTQKIMVQLNEYSD